jgi:dihydropteroate synthase
MHWQIRGQQLPFDQTLVMGILNVTPDSFSDGGRFLGVDDAIGQAERMIDDGADIIDIGGESTRPGSQAVDAEAEIERVVPVINAVVDRFDTPISIDTTKWEVAVAAINAGASIINDISGLRFEERIADVAAETKCGLVLMHSRGGFESMHSQPPVRNVFADVISNLNSSVEIARFHGVKDEQIVLDPGLGFGKTFEQNLELVARLNDLCREFSPFPVLVGASRKSFIGTMLGGALVDERKNGSLVMAAVAAWNGAAIIRAHDIPETVEAVRVIDALKRASRNLSEQARGN